MGDIRLVAFHGDVHDQEIPLARQVRAADDTRTSSAGPPGARDLNRKATERGVAAIRQDAQESLDYSVRTYYTKAGITCLQRTTTLPDGVRVRGSHCVTIGELGEIRITFYPAAVAVGREEFGQLGEGIPFESEKRPNAPGTRWAADRWYWRGEGVGGRGRRWLLRSRWPRQAAACGDRRGGRLSRIAQRWAVRGGWSPRGAGTLESCVHSRRTDGK